MEKMDNVFKEMNKNLKKKEDQIVNYTNIENLFQNKRRTILVTDEDSKQISMNSHFIKYGIKF
jgi:tRNA splicing endonuclease